MLTLSVFVATAVTVILGAVPPTCKLGVDQNLVDNKILYQCQATPGLPAYLPIACQIPNGKPPVFYPTVNNGVGTDDLFKYRCSRTGATSMVLDITGCIAPNGADIPFDKPYETQYNGVITCTEDSTGKVTRTVRKVCVRPNSAYYQAGATWSEADAKFKCSFENGEYHVQVTACVSGAVSANVNNTAKIGNSYYKCVKDANDETKATFQLINPSTCGDHELNTVWSDGDVAYKCVESGLKAIQIEFGCAGFGKTLAYGSYGKFGSDAYVCDKGTGKMRNITLLMCPGGHPVLSEWVENNVVYRCFFSSGNITYISATDCVAEDGVTRVPKGQTKQISGTNGVKYGFKCTDNGNNNLVGRRLNESEYAAFLKANGLDDGESQTGDGGEGDGKFVSISTPPSTKQPTSAAASTNKPQTAAPSTFVPAVNVTNQPGSTPTNRSSTNRPPVYPSTGSPDNSSEEDECEDEIRMCSKIAHLCMDGPEQGSSKGGKPDKGNYGSSESNSWEQKGSKGGKGGKGQDKDEDCDSDSKENNGKTKNNNKKGGKGSSSSEESKKGKKGGRNRRFIYGGNNKNNNKNQNNNGGYNKQNKGSGSSQSSNSASKENPGKSANCCGDVGKIKETIKMFVRNLCPKTCNVCRPSASTRRATPPPTHAPNIFAKIFG